MASVPNHMRPYFGTLFGIGLSVLAVVVWILTFDKEGGVELSGYLFPLSALFLKRLFPDRSIPVALWYGAAFFHWVALGALFDFVRSAFRKS